MQKQIQEEPAANSNERGRTGSSNVTSIGKERLDSLGIVCLCV